MLLEPSQETLVVEDFHSEDGADSDTSDDALSEQSSQAAI